eukprot:GILJ01008300.1.p1 GENE.GILJ01008300.1~~GILJ01008300.1.p1  ORF type:complete len:880 (-),score=161.77 GILJ01008300.1:97-2466(-)
MERSSALATYAAGCALYTDSGFPFFYFTFSCSSDQSLTDPDMKYWYESASYSTGTCDQPYQVDLYPTNECVRSPVYGNWMFFSCVDEDIRIARKDCASIICNSTVCVSLYSSDDPPIQCLEVADSLYISERCRLRGFTFRELLLLYTGAVTAAIGVLAALISYWPWTPPIANIKMFEDLMSQQEDEETIEALLTKQLQETIQNRQREDLLGFESNLHRDRSLDGFLDASVSADPNDTVTNQTVAQQEPPDPFIRSMSPESLTLAELLDSSVTDGDILHSIASPTSITRQWEQESLTHHSVIEDLHRELQTAARVIASPAVRTLTSRTGGGRRSSFGGLTTDIEIKKHNILEEEQIRFHEIEQKSQKENSNRQKLRDRYIKDMEQQTKRHREQEEEVGIDRLIDELKSDQNEPAWLNAKIAELAKLRREARAKDTVRVSEDAEKVTAFEENVRRKSAEELLVAGDRLETQRNNFLREKKHEHEMELQQFAVAGVSEAMKHHILEQQKVAIDDLLDFITTESAKQLAKTQALIQSRADVRIERYKEQLRREYILWKELLEDELAKSIDSVLGSTDFLQMESTSTITSKVDQLRIDLETARQAKMRELLASYDTSQQKAASDRIYEGKLAIWKETDEKLCGLLELARQVNNASTAAVVAIEKKRASRVEEPLQPVKGSSRPTSRMTTNFDGVLVDSSSEPSQTKPTKPAAGSSFMNREEEDLMDELVTGLSPPRDVPPQDMRSSLDSSDDMIGDLIGITRVQDVTRPNYETSPGSLMNQRKPNQNGGRLFFD